MLKICYLINSFTKIGRKTIKITKMSNPITPYIFPKSINSIILIYSIAATIENTKYRIANLKLF